MDEKVTNEEVQVCSICGKEFTEFGNDAWPVNDGICCDECNMNVVVPRRLSDYYKHEGE